VEVETETRRATGGATERAFLAASEIFARWDAERERSPVDRVVASEFRGRRYLNSGERRWVSSVVYGCVRNLRRQIWLLERLGLPPEPLNIVRLWTALPAEADADEVALRGPNAALPVTPEEIALAWEALPAPDAVRDHLRITLSFPDDMADELIELLGEDAVPAAAALNAQAPTTLRVNPLRVGRDHLLRALPQATPTHYSPWGLELPRRVNVPDLPGFRTGWFEVQEEASQLAALLADPLPGQTVVEIGAGAGGKTLALAALMDNRGTLLAVDTNAARLEELKRRAERAGVTCVQTVRVDADDMGWWQPGTAARRTLNKVQARADLVLIDAPCTGSGVLRRSPDAKWREMDRARLLALQQTLLAQGAMMTAPRGHLIYVTCAFERDQNEETIAAFQQTEIGRQFVVEPVAQRLTAACARAARLALLPPALRSAKSGRASASVVEPGISVEQADASDNSSPEADTESDAMAAGRASVDAAVTMPDLLSGSMLRTWPHRHGLDAFFVACLRRAAIDPNEP
jgi:16S rRNA (cytosine967-C5)-methyltransferase